VRLGPGTRVGPYEVVALLGSGGMAEVYRARDTRLGREVALKFVSEALGSGPELLGRLDREAKLAGSLNHPNVVAVHDIGLHDGSPYFVTELLQGESLRERLAKGAALPLGTALDWATQMAEGLAAAHERGIIHRDLKPENVFVTRDGHVKLLDFGIAKLAEAARPPTARRHAMMDKTSPSGSTTGTGVVLGTPGYMSPEQVRGDPVDARTDFFSLGAVLYEMLGRRRAFPGGPVVESGYAILHHEPEPLPPTVPAPLAQVVARCLEKDPARRFQSARDLAFNLELLRAPTGATILPAPKLRKPLSRLRLMGIAAVVLLAVTAAAYLSQRRIALPAPALKVEPITFRLGTVGNARFMADGRVVYAASWDGEPREVFIHAPDSREAQSLGLQGIGLAAVLPKGELAIWSRGTLALIPAAGGTPRELADDVLAADSSASGELAVVRAGGGKTRLEFPLGTPLFETTGRLTNPRVSPRGGVVAVVHARSNALDWSAVNPAPDELLLVDRQKKVETLLTFPVVQDSPDKMTPNGLAWLPSGEELWFSAMNAIWAMPLHGSRRLVYQGTVTLLTLQDISKTGTLLVDASDSRRELTFARRGTEQERRLSPFGTAHLSALSGDGKRILFAETNVLAAWASSQETRAYLGATEGSPPMKLGDGFPLALSPDEKWVLVRPIPYHDALHVVPVGVGSARTLLVPGLNPLYVRWLGDERILVQGEKADTGELRLYVMPVAGGTPTPVSPPVAPGAEIAVSLDGRSVATRARDGVLTVYSLDGGAPIPLPELADANEPVGWTDDGDLWYRAGKGLRSPTQLKRYSLKRKRVVEERVVGQHDPTGVNAVWVVRITPDGQSVAYDYSRTLGRLWLMDGLVAVR